MLKFPDSLKERDLKNVEISYGNNPISEHIGSLVFESLNIPVHETLLGLYDGESVVSDDDIRCEFLSELYSRRLNFLRGLLDQ